MMRIPQVGMPVLFCLRAANLGDNNPAEMRPAVITKVWNYTPDRVTVNLSVTLDGDDTNPAAYPGKMLTAGMLFASSASYDATPGAAAGTFRYPDDRVYACDYITVTDEITHGREQIRGGAIGIFDQQKNTVRFKRDDILNLAEGLEPEYRADKFIDQHIARLEMPEGWIDVVHEVPTDGSETPDERMFHIRDIMLQNRDPGYLKQRLNGMPAKQAPSLRESWRRRGQSIFGDKIQPRGNRGEIESGQPREPLQLTHGENGAAKGDEKAADQLQTSGAAR